MNKALMHVMAIAAVASIVTTPPCGPPSKCGNPFARKTKRRSKSERAQRREKRRQKGRAK